MDYSQIKNKLYKAVDNNSIERVVADALKNVENNMTGEVFEKCLAVVDHTSLNITDSTKSIDKLATKIAHFHRHYPHLPNVASLCVSPVFVETVGLALGESEMSITSVAGGFPSSQTFLEVKVLECSMVEESGADEIDIVMNMAQFMDGNYQEVAGEIEMIRNELDPSTILKVIIESGSLRSLTDVRTASLLAMAAGADFVKTSTGKNGAGATPAAVAVMCQAINDYFDFSGEKVGIKISGGIRTTRQAVEYYTIIESILGSDWITPELTRIGASTLTNNLITSIMGEEVDYF